MPVYDAYLLQSRFGNAVPIGCGYSDPLQPGLRTDLDVPVFVMETEGDVLNESFGSCRLVSPTRAVSELGDGRNSPRDHVLPRLEHGRRRLHRHRPGNVRHHVAPTGQLFDGAIKCDRPINAGPVAYVLRAVMRHINRWVRDGTAPAKEPPSSSRPMTTMHAGRPWRAIGGVRTPHVDVPVATLSGIGNSASASLRDHQPFDAATLAAPTPTTPRS